MVTCRWLKRHPSQAAPAAGTTRRRRRTATECFKHGPAPTAAAWQKMSKDVEVVAVVTEKYVQFFPWGYFNDISKKSDHDLVKGFSWLGQRLLPRTTTYNSQCMVPVQKAVDPKWSSDLKRAWDRDRRDGRKWMGSTWFQSRSPGFTRFTVYPMRFGIADSRKSPGNQPGKQPVRHEFSASGADWRNAQRIQYDNRLSASTTGSISPDAWKTLARVSLDHGIPWRAGRRFRCFLTRYPRGFGCNFMQFPYISITCGGWWLQNGRNMYKKNLESSEPFPQLTIFML